MRVVPEGGLRRCYGCTACGDKIVRAEPGLKGLGTSEHERRRVIRSGSQLRSCESIFFTSAALE